MRTVIEILEELQPGTEFAGEDKLIDEGLLDSFDLVSLIGELNDEFKIAIPMWEIIPDNFNSVEAIEKLVEKLVEKGKG